jgi:hypothetical protein
MLAHRQHDHLLGPARIVADGHAVGGRHLGHQFGQVGLHDEVGEAAHRRDHFVEVGLAAQVALDDGADEQVAQAPHGAHKRQAYAVRSASGLRFECRAEVEAGQRTSGQRLDLSGAYRVSGEPALIKARHTRRRSLLHGAIPEKGGGP